jgi:hypothetical protein
MNGQVAITVIATGKRTVAARHVGCALLGSCSCITEWRVLCHVFPVPYTTSTLLIVVKFIACI